MSSKNNPKIKLEVENLKRCFSEIITEVGEDVNRKGLRDTPKRAAEALCFLTHGYHQNLQAIINGAIFEAEMSQMIVVKDIELYSLCEHHLLPFLGKCHIAYLPKGKVIGLSKFARIVEYFARRLQIQEQLTQQIADCIMEAVSPHGVGVIIEAKHLCMMMRGVQKQNSVMTTSVMLGTMQTEIATRAEFLNLLRS